MIISWEINPTIFIALAVQVVLLVVGWVRTTDRASTAIKESSESKLGLSALNAAFNMFQVNVARDYVSREVLREFEERITFAARENADRLARDISELRDAIMKRRD